MKKSQHKQINPKFWKKYPSNKRNFDKTVLEGVWFHVDGYNPLPTSPKGYYWKLDNGGLKTPPPCVTYRLWNTKLGYMLRSE